MTNALPAVVFKPIHMFSSMKVDDRVWSPTFGWGAVTHIFTHCEGPYYHSFRVAFSMVRNVGGYMNELDYAEDGRIDPLLPVSLFWNEVRIISPSKPNSCYS